MSGAAPPRPGAPPPVGPSFRAAELMHPDGEVCSEGALGGRAARIRRHTHGGRPPELLWVAPTAPECRTRGWLAEAAARVGRELAPDGIAWVLPPRGWRGRAAAELRRVGLVVGPPVVHLRAGGSERVLLPLRPAETRILASLAPFPAPLRRSAAALARLPGWTRAVAEGWHTVGLLARRPESRPAYAWLRALGGDAAGDGALAVCGWRGEDDSVLLYLPGPGGTLAAVAKVARAGAEADEAEVLARLGDAARAAGAAVPQVLGSGGVAGRRVALLGAVPGERAALRLRSRPGRLGPLLELLAGWLGAWSRATRTVAPLRAEELEREVLHPLARIAPLLPEGEDYATRVRGLCAGLEGVPLPRVAEHRDLTLYNVLLDGGRLGVVDWEAARGDGWPLADLEYAATDAAAAVGGYRDRTAAWAECWRPGGSRAEGLGRRRAALAEALGVPPAFAELCRHACWLGHAAREHATGGAGPRPFLAVLRAVAQGGPA